jgi:hypothetical protein
MSVESHDEHPPAGVPPMPERPRWAWGESSAAPQAPPPAPSAPAAAPAEPQAAAPEPPAPEPRERPAWSWGGNPRAGLLARALARARAGVAGITPVDRTAARVQRVLVMAVLVGGWALSLSFPRFALALPVVAVVLLAATVHPALSLPRLISSRVLPATGLAGPWLTTEDPAPHRLGDAATGVVLVLASLCAILGAPVVAWTLGWAVIVASLVEFTFDVSLGVLIHSRLRRARVLRI